MPFRKSRLQDHVVVLFTAAELGKGPSSSTPWLLEYVPINVHERGFGLEDLDLTRSLATIDQDGRPVFAYHMKRDSADAYRDLSTEYLGFECAILFHGYVLSVPFFHSPLLMTSGAQMSMGTQAEVRAFVEEIRAMLPGR